MMYIKHYLPFILLILNFLEAETYPLAQKPFLNTINSADQFQRGTYLIIVADDGIEDLLSSIPSAGNFPYFKKTQGYDVEIWNFADIGTAEALRDSLGEYYSANNLLEYVLLIGDYDPDSPGIVYPIDSYTIASYNEAQNDVTDHPFTYFEGGPETDDGINPNYFIGRWSISSQLDVLNILKKTIQYTKMEYVSDPFYLERALVVAGSYKTVGLNSLETLPHNWPVSPVWTSIWLQDRLTQFGYSTVDTAFFYSGNMTTTNVPIENSWNDGVGIINYRGWGNAQGWKKPQFLSSNVDNLSYTYDLPVVFSFVCNTGDFGNDVDPCFGEKLIRAGSYSGGGRGAVAMIGPSDLDTDTRFNNVMCGALWDGLLEGRTPELAQALHAAKQAVAKEFDGIEETGVGGTQNIPVFYNHVYGVLGDPSLPVWLKTPATISVLDDMDESIEDTLKLTKKFNTIRVQNESGDNLQDVVGALLYDENLIAKGLSTYEGYMELDTFDVEIGTEMELYLNKAQYYQKRIPVIVSEIVDNTPSDHTYAEQIIEPENLYTVMEIDYNWIEINPENPDKVYDGENLYLTDDTIAKDIFIGFDFTYYGNMDSTINICSNGWAAFEESDIPYFWNFSIPFPMGPYGMLAVFMDDLDDNGKEPFIDNNLNHIYDSGDEFFTDCGTPDFPINPYLCHDYNQNGIHDDGKPFNVFKWYDEEKFIVQWDQVANAEDDQNCESTGCVQETFQLILYNPDYQNSYGQGNIVFQYKEIHDIDDGRYGKNGNLSTIGIESPDQNQGVQYLFRGKLQDGSELIDEELNGKAIQFSANQEISLGIIDQVGYQPEKIQLIGTYPNPFNPVTTILYELSEMSWIHVDVYNIRGQQVENLYKGVKSPGSYQLNWDASTYSSGMYFIVLSAPSNRLMQKVILLK